MRRTRVAKVCLAIVVSVVVTLSVSTMAGAASDAPLLDAVRVGDASRVQALVENHVDVNAGDSDGTTALHWAAHRGDIDIVHLLISAGADADVANRFGSTPLALASESGSSAAVDALLAAGADPDGAGPEGETALMTAARTGRVAVVRALLDRGADPNATERWRGQTALMWAAAESNIEAAEALIAGGAEIGARSSNGFSALMFAVRAGRLETVRSLLDAGAPVNSALDDGTSALVLATKNAHYDVGVLLLRAGADPNADDQGWTALHEIKWARRPNLGFNNPPPLTTGTVTDVEFVRALVAHGAFLDARQTKEPLNKYRNVLNRTGSTPFLLAAKAADLEMMRLLVELGADPLLPNEDGTNPLMVAAGVGIWAVGESPGTNEEALEAVKFALALGGDITTVDDNGDTAMHGATIRSSEPLIRFLLANGAEIDAVNAKGWTPLRMAKGIFYSNTGKRFPEMETLLLELGANEALAAGPDNTIEWSAGDVELDQADARDSR